MPVRWSIEVGEFIHNLRSTLDHMVWRLAAVHGDCTGRHGGDTCPGRHNRFPIHDIPGGRRGVRLLWGLDDLLRRSLVTTSVRWTGRRPRLASLASLQSMPKPADVSGPRDHQGSEVVRCGLRHGEAFLFTSGVRHRRYLEFQVNVPFDGSIGPESARCPVAAAAEVLDAGIESVDMVASRFRSDT